MNIVYVGVDLGSSNFHQVAVNEAGVRKVNREFATSEANLIKAFADQRGEIHVHLEAGELAPWAISIIRPLVSRVVCSHPQSNAWIAKDADKSDRIDAFKLADLLRLNRFKEVHYPQQQSRRDFKTLVQHYDELTQQGPTRYREWAEVRVEALNHALRDIPEDRVRYHICFGSWHVPHVSDAPLEDIVDLMLEVKAGAYSIEAANVRHEHERHVWEKTRLQAGKILIPGIITHHTTTVEHPKLVAERIVNFAKLVGRENVIAGSDCGFAQAEGIQRVHPQVMWAKYEALAEGARLASKQLWS